MEGKTVRYVVIAAVAFLIISFIVPWTNKASMGDVQSYMNDGYDVVNAKIVEQGSDYVILSAYAEPEDFLIMMDIATSDDLAIGESAFIIRDPENKLDGAYQYETRVALSKESTLFDSIVEAVGVRTSSIYSGYIVGRS